MASLFRNYLLAERIMRTCGCTPQSLPQLPATHGHPMWHAWDMAVEACMLQLPAMLAAEAAGQPSEFVTSPFFTDQLTAFEVWLENGSKRKAPPEQLPIVLQARSPTPVPSARQPLVPLPLPLHRCKARAAEAPLSSHIYLRKRRCIPT